MIGENIIVDTIRIAFSIALDAYRQRRSQSRARTLDARLMASLKRQVRAMRADMEASA